MAYIKRSQSDGSLLVGYRPRAGAPERFGVCPTRDDFEAFQLLERQHRRAGVEVPNPSTLYARPAAPEAESTGADVTLREWIGDPKAGKPGDFFENGGPRSGLAQVGYKGGLVDAAPVLADLPLCKITRAKIIEQVHLWLRCPQCAERAARAGVELPPAALSVLAEDPWDGAGRCSVKINKHVVSTHYPKPRRGTVIKHLARLSAALNAGMRAEPPLCSTNPVTSYTLPPFPHRANNQDQTQALDHTQLKALSDAHPAHLAAVPKVMAYGLLRRSECFGIDREDISWPGPDDHGVALISVKQVYVADVTGRFHLRPWGKTAASTTHPVFLARQATEALRAHMDDFRSTPSPDHCAACAAGTREWADKVTNPHTFCDFANDAPVFVGLGGERQDPNAYSDLFGECAIGAGLTRKVLGFTPTPKILRATGGTLLLELGVPDEVVMRMGRWTSIETLKRHYTKIRDRVRQAAAELMGDAAAAELGEVLDESTPADIRLLALARRAENAEAEVARLTDLVLVLGGDPTMAPITRVVVPVRSLGVTGDREALAAALDGAANIGEVCTRLGVAKAGSNYRRITKAARRFDLDLPPAWGRAS